MLKIITPDSNREILQTTLPEAMVDSYGEMPNLDGARKALSWADVVVAGPGMGQGEDARRCFIRFWRENAGTAGRVKELLCWMRTH